MHTTWSADELRRIQETVTALAVSLGAEAALEVYQNDGLGEPAVAVVLDETPAVVIYKRPDCYMVASAYDGAELAFGARLGELLGHLSLVHAGARNPASARLH